MAWQNQAWAWSVVGVRGSHYVVLHALAQEADRRGIVDRLTLQRLSALSNVTYACVRRITNDLQDWGFIDIQARVNARGTQVANGYRLHMERIFPQTSDIEQSGEQIGGYIWSGLLSELESMRGSAEVHLLKAQVREAFFDSSNRCNRTEQWKGVLHIIAEDSVHAVQLSLKQNLKYLMKIRDLMSPYLVDYFAKPIPRPQFDEEEEEEITETSEAPVNEEEPC